ncbi:MAG: hypothetical protein O3C43_20490 [Verrucomicrobia bacterium]|nr:hypothetical protein [Verrucomicrobiota bacterium]MDA1068871.1 hypothetical protein [Verrucomicrobiota bacterium]
MSSLISRFLVVFIPFLLFLAPVSAKPAKVTFEHPKHELPQYLADVLSDEDRELFTRLLNINIESAWGYLRTHGYP